MDHVLILTLFEGAFEVEPSRRFMARSSAYGFLRSRKLHIGLGGKRLWPCVH